MRSWSPFTGSVSSVLLGDALVERAIAVSAPPLFARSNGRWSRSPAARATPGTESLFFVPGFARAIWTVGALAALCLCSLAASVPPPAPPSEPIIAAARRNLINVPLLVGRGALGAGERVADRRRQALHRVARARRQRQRHQQVVGRAVRQQVAHVRH